MKNNLRKIFAFFALLGLVSLFAVSCRSDDDESPSASRDFKYEVTGNYSGPMTVIYFEGSGSAHTIDVAQLPWTKEITLDANSMNGAGLGVQSGSTSGQPGQTVTLKIYQGGSLVKQDTFTADSSGDVSGNIAYAF